MVTNLISKMKGKGILNFVFILATVLVSILLINNVSATVTSISLVSPNSGYKTTDSTPIFEFKPYNNISGYNINCTLIIDSNNYGTSNNIKSGYAKKITASPSLNIGTHTWYISCRDSESERNSTSRTIEIIDTPGFCDDTTSGDFSITIDDLDSGDEFTIGENISFTVNVENEGDDDMSVYVEARLYDLTDEDEISIVKIKKTIDENDDVDYSIKLIVPYDVDEDHDFIIQIKAYQSGNEDDNCNEKSISISLERESNLVVLDRAYSSSDQVDCNMYFDFTARVANAGSQDEEDVKFRIYNTELGIDASKIFDLDSGDKETMYFNFLISENATPKNYTLNMIVYYDDMDSSNSYSYKIEVLPTRCKIQTPTPYTNYTNVTKEILFTTNQLSSAFTGSQFLIKVDVTNMNNVTSEYLVLAKDYSEWAVLNSITPTMLILAPGQTSSVYIALTPLNEANAVNTFKVSVASGTSAKEQIITVNLQGTSKPASILDQLIFEFNRQWWLFGINLILLIGIIILLIAVFRPRKKTFPAAEIRLKQAKNGNGNGKKK